MREAGQLVFCLFLELVPLSLILFVWGEGSESETAHLGVWSPSF